MKKDIAFIVLVGGLHLLSSCNRRIDWNELSSIHLLDRPTRLSTFLELKVKDLPNYKSREIDLEKVKTLFPKFQKNRELFLSKEDNYAVATFKNGKSKKIIICSGYFKVIGRRRGFVLKNADDRALWNSLFFHSYIEK